MLDRVKALSLLPDGMQVTTAMVAAYFEAGIAAVHRGMLEEWSAGEPLKALE